jgi:hypothetical protein
MPYSFWGEAARYFAYAYARARTSDKPSPYERRYGTAVDAKHLLPFGSACYFYEDDRDAKFDRKSSDGVILGLGQLKSYLVLDFGHYVRTKGQIKIRLTRDVKPQLPLRFPFLDFGVDADAEGWLSKLLGDERDGPIIDPTTEGPRQCPHCEMWQTDEEPRCKACRGKKRAHVRDHTCLK